ncbi:MAG TPA: Trx7/PDZ domain-containing (seleno)protein [Pirellulaceae bacterium]|nr:Trx7/PDZ domain-containing (seleno)protein [Pirellulaceae bacterium]
MSRSPAVALACLVLFPLVAAAQTREQKVRADKEKVEAAGFWIYNDLPKAFAEAKQTGQPLVVALRCIPCVECVKLDDELVDQDERLQAALEKFVRVRVVSANGLDLSLFQFDTDQSFAVFMLNADGTIYGRYGTRSDHSHWADDVSVEGLAKALEGALELHAEYPANKAVLAAKRGPKPDFAAPENYPTLKGKYGSQLNYEGNVVQSCIHCHQIGDAQRQFYRDKETALPDRVLFPYPHPKSLGLILDPKERATVLRVEPGSLAAKAGFEAGDQIRSLSSQPLLSMADVQWVLHHVQAEGGSVPAIAERRGKAVQLTLSLPAGWRGMDDISWRASSWELRRIGLGGLLLKDVSAELREKQNLPAEGLALRVEHLGQYPPHNVAQQAGFRKDDVLIAFDGRTDLARETDLLHYTLNDKKPGSSVPVTVLREGKKIDLTLPIGK